MAAAGGLDRDRHEAKGAFFLAGPSRGLEALLEFVHGADHQEYGERHDDEIHARIDELAVIQCDGLAPFPRYLQHEGQVAEIHVPDEQPHGRHQYVVHEGRDDFAEGSPDDDANRQVDDVSFECKPAKIDREGHGWRLTTPYHRGARRGG